MTTSLTFYAVNSAATTLPNAVTGVSVLGGATVGIDNLVGTATGYGEWRFRGNSGAWAALGAIGSPTGRGALWDVSTLEIQAIAAGTWTPTVRGSVNSGNGNIGMGLYFRAFIYHSNGTYTLIGTMSLLSQTLTSTSTDFVFGGTSLPEADFGSVGDKLYCDFWPNITSNGSGTGINTLSTAKLRFNLSNSATQGVNKAQIVTPGYYAITQISTSDSGAGGETVAAAITEVDLSVSDNATGAESEAITASVNVSDEVPVPVALTVYGSNVVSSTLSHAGQLVTTTGSGVDSGIDTLIGTASGGWLQWYARGNSSPQTLTGSIGSEDGHGLCLDSVLLEECYLADGNWQPTLKGTLHNGVGGNVTADITVRVSVYHGADGSYTTIGSVTLASQTISSSGSTLYSFAATELPQAPLGVGDRLYIGIWFNVLTNTNTNTAATLRFNLSSNTSGVTDSQVTTPGYFPIQAQEQIQVVRPPVVDTGAGGEGTDVSVRAPLNAPYSLPGVATGGPYVVANNGFFAQGGLNLRRLYGCTFWPASQGGSPSWQSNAMQPIIDDVISVAAANRFMILRPTDQWGKVPTLSWDNPQIWTNMDYLIQQAALNGILIQLDLSGWKNVLLSRGITNAFQPQYWTDYLTAVGSHYANVNNIAFITIAGEPTFPRTQSDVDALVSFFQSTIATYKAADSNHLVSPGGFINMNNGLLNWWQQIWAINGVDVCCYKTYSLNDLNNIATYSSYAVNTLGKIPVQQEFGIQGFAGDGVWTGQSFNNYNDCRANYYDQVLTNGEQNGTRAFIFWNYSYQATSFVPPDDQPAISDAASGSEGIAVPANNTGAVNVLDQAAGSDVLTLYGQSYDLNPESFPVTWGALLNHIGSDTEVVDPGAGSESLSISATVPVAGAGTGTENEAISATVPAADAATGGTAISIFASVPVADTAVGVDVRGAIATPSDGLVYVCSASDSLVYACSASDQLV